mgnify:CR=1 FL=1
MEGGFRKDIVGENSEFIRSENWTKFDQVFFPQSSVSQGKLQVLTQRLQNQASQYIFFILVFLWDSFYFLRDLLLLLLPSLFTEITQRCDRLSMVSQYSPRYCWESPAPSVFGGRGGAKERGRGSMVICFYNIPMYLFVSLI